MADEKKRVGGELVAWLIRSIPPAVWGGLPREFEELNPYREERFPDDALLKHKAWLADRRRKILAGKIKPGQVEKVVE